MKFDSITIGTSALFALLAFAQAAPLSEETPTEHGVLDKRVKILVNIGLMGESDISEWAGWLNGENPCHLISSDKEKQSAQYFNPHVSPFDHVNPCGHKFTIYTGTGSSSYTWEGCGKSQTWLNHAGGGFAGNCQWAPKTITCANVFGLKIRGQYQCTADA